MSDNSYCAAVLIATVYRYRCKCVAYVGVVGYKVRADEVPSDATEHIDKGCP